MLLGAPSTCLGLVSPDVESTETVSCEAAQLTLFGEVLRSGGAVGNRIGHHVPIDTLS